MQQSVSPEYLRGAVEASIREMEMLCGRAERALMLRRWHDLDQAIADARRATHALQNAMEDASDVRDAVFDEDIMRRLRYVAAIRENQMTRLQQYHDAVGERLQLVARWKSALKSMAGRGARKRLSALDQLS
ncbi:MAG TPA: hypothetical protein VFN37_06645 [Candidatus Baltobacteraceae bacterium]|nr:hypothetical protein [Candidatus Baltobacteraceae bacterium]